MDRIEEVLARATLEISPSLHVVLESFEVLRRALGQLFLLGAVELHLESFRNLFRDLFLHREHVGKLAIVLLPPDLMVVCCINQLDADGKIIAALHNATGHYRAHFQFAPDGRRVSVLALVTKDRTARDHAEIRKLRQAVDYAFSHAVA